MQPAEKNSILGALGWVRHEDALKIVIAALDDPQCSAKAAEVVVKLAESLKRSHPALVKSGLEKVLATTKDDKLKELATEILRQ